MFESCSSCVLSTSSPAPSVRPTARVNASVSVVMLGPNTMPSASAPRKVATVSRAERTSSPVATLAPNRPPLFAFAPLRR